LPLLAGCNIEYSHLFFLIFFCGKFIK
jgi:NADH:ubiquinone oxidoreductase subunit H